MSAPDCTKSNKRNNQVECYDTTKAVQVPLVNAYDTFQPIRRGASKLFLPHSFQASRASVSPFWRPTISSSARSTKSRVCYGEINFLGGHPFRCMYIQIYIQIYNINQKPRGIRRLVACLLKARVEAHKSSGHLKHKHKTDNWILLDQACKYRRDASSAEMESTPACV